MEVNSKCLSCHYYEDCREHGVTPEECNAIFNEENERNEMVFYDGSDDIQYEEYYNDTTRSRLVF